MLLKRYEQNREIYTYGGMLSCKKKTMRDSAIFKQMDWVLLCANSALEMPTKRQNKGKKW